MRTKNPKPDISLANKTGHFNLLTTPRVTETQNGSSAREPHFAIQRIKNSCGAVCVLLPSVPEILDCRLIAENS